MDQIARLILDVDYFVFVQTEQMDGRDLRPRGGGVYNRELALALERGKAICRTQPPLSCT